MHKIFSTRLDEDLVRQIDRFVRERSITKKSLIEKAVRAYLEQMGEKLGHDIVDRSFGAWRREETAQETWSRAREAFNRGFERHKESSR
jgi:hypothetical protein